MKVVTCAMLFSAVIVLPSACSYVEIEQEEGADAPSEIALAERSMNTRYFKRDLQIEDQRGENSIVLRFGASDQALVDEYIAAHEFTLLPVEKRAPSALRSLSESLSSGEPPAEEPGLLVEVVEPQLQSGVIGYGISIKRNPEYKTSRVAHVYQHSAQFTSTNWPEELHVQSYSRQLHEKVKYKDRWWKGWETAWEHTVAPYTTEHWNVDGPYRVCLEVSYDYDGDFAFYFVNW